MTQDTNRQNELKKMELCAMVTVTKYRCDRCGTAWEYENDKSNIKVGWSVVGR